MAEITRIEKVVQLGGDNIILHTSKSEGELDMASVTVMPQQKSLVDSTTTTSNNLVIAEHPVRTNFKKSHTCGSLYAKCTCSEPISCNNNSLHSRRCKKLFQSFSHPDTAFIFTHENKKPTSETVRSWESRSLRIKPHARTRTISTKSGTVEITTTNCKRLSSPNIGNFTILDVAVHPELILKITKRNSPNKVKSIPSTPNNSPNFFPENLLTKIPITSSSGSAATLSPTTPTTGNARSDSVNSEYSSSGSVFSEGEIAEDDESDNAIAETRNFQIDDLENSNNKENNRKIIKNLEYHKYNALSYQQNRIIEDPAQKYFKESGILGPMGNGASNLLLRKTSKIAATDPATLDQIRKNSRAMQKSTTTYDTIVTRKKSIPNEYDYFRASASAQQQQQQQQKDIESVEDQSKIIQEEVANLRELLKNRDDEIDKLKREIHKLKSVLQQTTNHMRLGEGDLLSCLQTHHCMAGQQSITCCGNINNIGATAAAATTTTSTTVNNTNSVFESINMKNMKIPPIMGHQQHQLSMPTSAAVKKQGVSGESCDLAGQQSSDILIQKYDKDFRSKQLIKDAIMDNDFLKNIDSLQVRELVESMYSREIPKGQYVIREGEAGAHLYVSAEGEFEVIKDGKVLGNMGPGKAFGELAILYNCTRTASIRVLKDSRVWVLDRRVFQQIMMRTGMQRIEENVKFLRSVPLLKDLSNDILTKIADVLEVEFYPAGSYIIRQGASGDTFFLISQGNVKVTQRLPGTSIEEEIRTLGRGDYFGEQALIKEDKRTANIIALSPGVECLTLDRVSFTQLIGDLCELQEKDYGDENRVIAFKQSERKLLCVELSERQELLDIELNDLETVATLGMGGFGRVELVKYMKDNQIQTYALKCLKKQHIVDTRQEEHAFSERTIMLSCNTPFICRLYRTYRDNKYVYMLLEACMGGEVWTILRDRGYFDDSTTQFIIGCVLQAFDYLHARGIVYRDLKPENLMLDSKGYIKLVDFGFAKYIGYSSKTWTFCGTPEYVAPEIILNKGHDRAVDYWALGVLIHELLTGTPPFTASDPMKTYNIILKGIDMVDFPRHMSRAAVSLIKRLCRDIPAERLGYQKGGIQDIKKHKWFQGFDWDGLASLSLTPPIIQPVEGPLDTANFDIFPIDTDIPPDEMSGWDAGF